jgi:prepilin-type N-terminal cleavage/methylation domain-containing protein
MTRRGLTLLELLVVLTILVSLATLIVPMIGSFGRLSQQMGARENLLRLQELLVNQYKANMGELPRPNLAVSATRKNHPQLRYLFVNPDTEDLTVSSTVTLLNGRVWRGPYLLHKGAKYQILADADPTKDPKFTDAYGLGDVVDASGTITTPGDPTVLDAWGRPIVIQEPCVAGDFNPTAEEKTYTRLVSAGPNGKLDTPETVLMPTKIQRSDDVVVYLYRADAYGDETYQAEP